MKKLQIFISSTYEDLKDERQEMVRAILTAGHIPAGMELFGGSGKVIDIIKKWIDESDVFFLLFGGMYGSIYEEAGISFTEWEYRYAKSVNKPICIIIVEDEMLFENAKKIGKDKVFEKKNIEKYECFKQNLLKDRWCSTVSNILQISAKVQASIYNIINDDKLNLIGWVRGDSLDTNWNDVSNKQLVDTYCEIFNSHISRYYNQLDMSDFSKNIGKRLLNVVCAEGILDLFHRIVRIYKENNELIKVVIYDEYEYRYLDTKHHAFGKKFQATKQQAESYKVEKLLINNVDFTNDFVLDVSENKNRGQLRYYVQSRKSIPLGNQFPVGIYYVSSYVCPALDFFQGFGLPFPCKTFNAEIFLEDGLENDYSIVVSTNSMFSKEYSDSFQANEMKNFGGCTIKLPEWSLASAGYVVTLKQKSENNH